MKADICLWTLAARAVIIALIIFLAFIFTCGHYVGLFLPMEHIREAWK